MNRGPNGVFDVSWNHDGSKVAEAGQGGQILPDPKKITVVLKVKAYVSKSMSQRQGTSHGRIRQGFGKGDQPVNHSASIETAKTTFHHYRYIPINALSRPIHIHSLYVRVYENDTPSPTRSRQEVRTHLEIAELYHQSATIGMSFFPKRQVDLNHRNSQGADAECEERQRSVTYSSQKQHTENH